MDVLVTCKYEEDPIKNEGARVLTLYSNFSDAQGQITLVLVSVSGRNLNSSKLSCMSSLPARMRMIDSKMKAPHRKCRVEFHWIPVDKEIPLEFHGKRYNSTGKMWNCLW